MSEYTRNAPRLQDLGNYSAWNDWLTADYEKRHAVLRDNRAAFRFEWGPHLCCFTGSEYRYWIWRRVHGDWIFYVLSGRRGTSVEVLRQNGRDPPDDAIREVLEALLRAAEAEDRRHASP